MTEKTAVNKKKKVKRKIICIVLIITILTLSVLVFGRRKASWISDERHIERISERIQKRYIDGGKTVGYSAVKPTSFKVTPLYNENDEMKYCLVEFEPYGYIYVLIRDEASLAFSWYGVSPNFYMIPDIYANNYWRPCFVNTGNDNEVLLETDKNKDELLTWCSEKHTLSAGSVEVEFCECCSLGMLAEKNGEYNEFSKRADMAELPPTAVTINYTIKDCISWAGMEAQSLLRDLDRDVTTEAGIKSLYSIYYEFFDWTQDAFNASNHPVSRNAKYSASTGAFVGINTNKLLTFDVEETESPGSEKYLQSSTSKDNIQPFTISYSTEEEVNSEYRTIVSRLFGYENVDTFTQYAQKLVNNYEFKENEVYYDGAIESYDCWIMPYAFKNERSETVLAYVIVNSSDEVYVWISNVEAAKTATNYNGVAGTDERVKLEVYGRCILFEQAHETRYNKSPFAIRARSDEKFYFIETNDTYIPAVKRDGKFINLYTNEEFLTYKVHNKDSYYPSEQPYGELIVFEEYLR